MDRRQKAGEVHELTIVSVEPTDRFETVYCFEVPTTHSFVLADNQIVLVDPRDRSIAYVIDRS